MSILVTPSARQRLELPDRFFGSAGRLAIDDFATAHTVAAALEARTPASDHPFEAADVVALDLLFELTRRLVTEPTKSGVTLADRLLEGLRRRLGDAGLERLGRRLGLTAPSGPFGETADESGALRSCALELLLGAYLVRHPRARRLLACLGLEANDEPAWAATVEWIAEWVDAERELSGEQRRWWAGLGAPTDAAGSFREVLTSLQETSGTLLTEAERQRLGAVLGLMAESAVLRGAPSRDAEATVGLTAPASGRHGSASADASTEDGMPEHDAAPGLSTDSDWMPRLVLVAKNVLVWLRQLEHRFGGPMVTLDDIPDAALAELAEQGFTGLWLIGLWERSPASARLKRAAGQYDAVASAYSVRRYRIADELGGDAAADRLAERAAALGLRLAADFVPNHTSIDSDWVVRHPERFVSVERPPFPGYRFTGEDLSPVPEISIRVEDGYHDRSDAAVVFERRDRDSGEALYLYHGNDGTATPWNDTAQIDFADPAVRETVLDGILTVAKRFPILRFDAAMTLARQHFHRLWYPSAEIAGAIPSRAEHGMSAEEMHRKMPREFWALVVETLREEAPDTLLLAEAFWLMEGYFVRELGLHRVYNSAFMHMLRDGRTVALRELIEETVALDPGILCRFVNYLSNPDEETAAVQFGRGDRYFGACRILATLPGLPMFAHGQWEGLEEKYGMEFAAPRSGETADDGVARRHRDQITPLLARRDLFSGVASFALVRYEQGGGVVDSVLAYVNGAGDERVLVAFNNSDRPVDGWVGGEACDGWSAWSRTFGEPAGSLEFADPSGSRRAVTSGERLGEGLALPLGPWECAVLVASAG